MFLFLSQELTKCSQSGGGVDISQKKIYRQHKWEAAYVLNSKHFLHKKPVKISTSTLEGKAEKHLPYFLNKWRFFTLVWVEDG